MHDNPRAVSGPEFALPSHSVVALTGRDAAAFAQAQFMNDVNLLAPGQWQWSGWLTPKGRVIALFALLKLDDETLWLVLPDADPAGFSDALRRFVFRSKVAIAVRGDLFASGGFSTPARAVGNALAGDASGGIELDLGGAGGERHLRINADAAAVDSTAAARWALFDLQHGLPRLSSPQADQWTPQQLSLERLRAFSVKKGCYPGQEIVARTHFLGKVKRGLALLEANAAIATGSEVRGVAGPLGTVIASASSVVHMALAVLPLERAPQSLAADGQVLFEIPLQDGLAR
jgi:folate-binding protein YgfZ